MVALVLLKQRQSKGATMNNKNTGGHAMKKLPLALAISALAATSVQATEFAVGAIDMRLDNTVSAGIGWRLQEPGAYQIMPGNGAASGNDATGSSYNYDDGTQNYGKGDVYTRVIKWTSDLEMTYQNYGGFFRVRAFYDDAIMNDDTDFKALSNETKDAAGRGYDLLDAYVWGDFDIGETPLSVRLGRQVLSWGESTFIQGGINSINPVDASAFRKPGAELKEGLLPVNMLYTSVGLTPDLSVEAFYQLQWEKTRTDPCGTFFSSSDFVADGCGPVILGGSSSELDILAARDQEVADNQPLSERVAPVAERLSDDEPRDSGQYGLALRWYSEALGDTEFGAYYMNIHSRLPFINGVVVNKSDSSYYNANATYESNYPLYQIAYPEDIQVMGLSFATATEGGASVSGEISYRPDMPLQWNAFELLLAGNAAPYSRMYQQRLAEVGGNPADLSGELAVGYDQFDMWQAQTTYIAFFDRILGSDRAALVGELGVSFIPDLPDTDDARYGRSGAYGIGNNDGVYSAAGDTNFCTADTVPGTNEANSGKNVHAANCTDDGYVTRLSGGVRLRMSFDYNNALAGVNITPIVSLAYDKGNGPEPGAQFIDNRLTTGLAMRFVYLNKTSVDVSYTNYTGGDYNQIKDRDNISLSASYSF
tara:strand:+ start:9899 stop:11851 length:1953 start_codon:yes stop_codon:yes gene_type:complete